eukprot:318135-Ditylum_brightwellii.AAC.1
MMWKRKAHTQEGAKSPGYHYIWKDCSTLQSLIPRGNLGGGVMNTLQTDRPELKFADLPDINQGCNDTMEYTRVQMFLMAENKPLPFDICNLHILLIGGRNDNHIQCFNAERTYGQFTQEAIKGGGIKSHHHKAPYGDE